MRILKALIVVLALNLLLVGAFATSTTASPDPQTGYNSFFTRCSFDLSRMRNQVDPILAPGIKPSAHSHDAYGQISFTQNLKPASVLPAGSTSDPGYAPVSSTCAVYADWPIYWFPTGLFDGVITPNKTDPTNTRTVRSSWLLNTYRSPVGVTVNPIPYGAAMIAGKSSAQNVNEEDPHLQWTCGEIDGGSRRPIDCTGHGVVTAVLTFPDCWDGLHGWGTDGWDGANSTPSYDITAGIAPSNFAYSVNGTCPEGFPVRMNQLVTRQHFTDPRSTVNAPLVDPFTDQGTIGLSFASGGYWTYHGDFMNLWGKTLFLPLTNKCNNLQTFRLAESYDCLDGLKGI